MSAKHYRPDPTPLLVIAVLIILAAIAVVVVTGCTVTEAPPTTTPVKYRECGFDHSGNDSCWETTSARVGQK